MGQVIKFLLTLVLVQVPAWSHLEATSNTHVPLGLDHVGLTCMSTIISPNIWH